MLHDPYTAFGSSSSSTSSFLPASSLDAAAPESSALVVTTMVPSDTEMEAFKVNVRAYLDADNAERRMKEALKEMRAAKRQASSLITQFMGRFNVEDLNTRDGRLRYRVTTIKAPLTQRTIRERLTAFLESRLGATDNVAEIVNEARDKVFARDTVDKTSLRRLRDAPRPAAS